MRTTLVLFFVLKLSFISSGQNYSKESKHVHHNAEAKLALWNAERTCKYLTDNNVTKEELEKGLEYFDTAIKLGFEDSYIYFEKALCEYHLEKDEEAIADFTISLKIWKPVPENYLKELASSVVTSNSFYREDSYVGKDSLGEFISTNYGIPSISYNKNDNYFFRGATKRNVGDYLGAIKDLNLIEKYYSASFSFYLIRAECKSNLRKYSEAKLDFTSAIKLDPDSPDIGYCFHIRGWCNWNLGLKETACLDWSNIRKRIIKPATPL
jgi:tetratricopeptide (TPR) repeat protein